MPRGFDTARNALADIEARKNSGGGGGQFFKLDDGEEATVRFLEDDVLWYWVHQLPPDGNAYRSEVCLDQDPETGNRTGEPCPGCDKEQQSGKVKEWSKRDYRRKMSGVANIIQREAPLFAEDENGRKNFAEEVGKADQVVKWTFGSNVISDLEKTSSTYKGLTSRDFRVKRTGVKLNTEYHITPVINDEGDPVKTPMSAADKELAEKAPDLAGFFKRPSYEEWGVRNSGSSDESSAPAPPIDPSPFRR
jgi:hypothetical protein